MQDDFSRVIDLLPGLVWTALPDGRADFVNKRWCEYTGLSFDDARGEGWQAALHPVDAPRVLEEWRSFTTSGKPGELEARLRRVDGAYHRFLFRFSPIIDASGEVVSWCGVNTDIEERKSADEAARRWAETLLSGEKRLLEMVAQGATLTAVLEALCGLVEDAAPGCLCSILSIDPDGVRFRHGAGPSLPDAYNEVLDGLVMDRNYGPCGMAAELCEQVIAADVATDPRWSASPWPSLVIGHALRSCWSTPILSRDGKVIGVFALYQHQPGSPDARELDLIRQFTHIASIAIERAQSEEQLRRSNEHLAEAQRLSLTGSFTWDATADEHYWSDEVYRMFGFDASKKVSLQLIFKSIHPEDMPLIEGVVAQASEGRDFEIEFRAIMPGGSVKHLHVVAHRARDRRDRTEFLGAIRDVTERKLSEEAIGKVRAELAQMARVTSLGALTASIAHEVNQPLSGIITNASTCLKMLAADPPNVAGARETARRTVRDGNRAADVIKRLRSLFANRGVTNDVVDLNESAREVIALSWSDLQRSRVIVRSELAPGLPSVTGDRVQLQQVILNLLLNAADAMSEVDDRPRQVLISTSLEDAGQVRLDVTDAGVGLGPGAAERLFEAFYTTKSEGMGIGLSISRSIVESHGGRLWAAANDGPGATFAFVLPSIPEVVAAGWRGAPAHAASDLRAG